MGRRRKKIREHKALVQKEKREKNLRRKTKIHEKLNNKK